MGEVKILPPCAVLILLNGIYAPEKAVKLRNRIAKNDFSIITFQFAANVFRFRDR